MTKPQVLFVLTSHSELGDTGKKIGWYLPEFAHPYNVLAPHSDITVASPAGGKAPLDPSSVEYFKDDAECVSFHQEKAALWETTQKLSDLVDSADRFSAIFFVGGHGPMFDLATNPTSHALIRNLHASDRIISAVCHGPAALANVRLHDGSYLIADAPVTGFSDAEEDAMGFTPYMPFSLQEALDRNSGGRFEKAGGNMEPWVVVAKGGKLLTGQNPASSKPLAEEILKRLREG
ncbi:MAG: hypothetical protein HETSPECPRED_006611 [Heterodermia speciosa]|uniref:D-lactate dehydratase n=1 Tax=Heterodermia speciosa TaxID=116794 RepID=A0A8H3IGV4_9LECA|nr:MAG: hypothetical protein HETSPECPRED_006611 [Heterodermia speciosa]